MNPFSAVPIASTCLGKARRSKYPTLRVVDLHVVGELTNHDNDGYGTYVTVGKEHLSFTS